VRSLARAHADSRIAVGLNNISHLAVARALDDCPTVWFFADFFLYAANDVTLDFLCRRVPRLLFACEWLEAPGARARTTSPAPTVRITGEFAPPLFVSLGCFRRHSEGRGRCSEDCPRDFSGELRQGRNRFRLVVRDCVTYLFLLS